MMTLNNGDVVQESSSRNSLRGKLDLKYSSQASVRRPIKLDYERLEQLVPIEVAC